MHEGRPYVELNRVAASIQTRPDATPGSIHAYLRIPGHTVMLTRNWARVVVDDKPLVLDAPVRVRKGVWLVPDTFVDRVMPKLMAAPPRAAPPHRPSCRDRTPRRRASRGDRRSASARTVVHPGRPREPGPLHRVETEGVGGSAHPRERARGGPHRGDPRRVRRGRGSSARAPTRWSREFDGAAGGCARAPVRSGSARACVMRPGGATSERDSRTRDPLR